jgi:hypothetical protein
MSEKTTAEKQEGNEEAKDQTIKAIDAIITNYLQNEEALVKQLFFETSHGTALGSFREEVWKGMFEQIIPKKFMIEQSVFIIDSYGNISREVDLAIFDETYTPYIFRYGKLKFIPIEAVAVAIECKSLSMDKESLEEWVERIELLKTSRDSYVRMVSEVYIGSHSDPTRLPTQTSTRPMRILCCLNNQCKDYCQNDFDVVIRANKEKGLSIEIDKNKKNLYSWYLSLNHADGTKENHAYCLENIDEKDTKKIKNIKKLQEVSLKNYEVQGKDGNLVSLLTFNLQLNQILMMINNPMLFPHRAYAEMFNNVAEKIAEEEKKNGK